MSKKKMDFLDGKGKNEINQIKLDKNINIYSITNQNKKNQKDINLIGISKLIFPNS